MKTITKKQIKEAVESTEIITYNGINGKEFKNDLYSTIIFESRTLEFNGLTQKQIINILTEKYYKKGI